MKNKRKNNLILLLFFILLVLGLGYAYLTTTLNINGTTGVAANTWNVYWDNVVVTEGSVSATTPTISSNKTTVTFSAHLSKPGDFYEFTVDAKNDGSMDAMIGTLNLDIFDSDGITPRDLPDYLRYDIKYAEDIEIDENYILVAGTKDTYRVRVEYLTNLYPEELPSNNDSLVFKIEIEYKQKDDNGIVKPYYIYHYSPETFCVGNAIPDGIRTFDNYEAAVTGHSNCPIILRTLMKNNLIQRTDVGFVLNGDVYFLKVDTGTEFYSLNVNMLRNAFGESNCTENYVGYTTTYSCILNNIHATVYVYRNYNRVFASYRTESLGCDCVSNTNNSGSSCDS